MIQIGTAPDCVKSTGKGENYGFEFDDRQELVKTIHGAVVVDPWNGSRVASGDVVTVTAMFDMASATTVRGWWADRSKHNVTLDDGSTIPNARIIVRRIEFINMYETRFCKLGLEFWRV